MLLIFLTIDINLIFSSSISWNVDKQGNISLAAVDSSAFWYHKWKLFFIWKLRQRSYILFLTWKLVLNYSFSLMEKRMWVNLWLQLKHVGMKALLKPPLPFPTSLLLLTLPSPQDIPLFIRFFPVGAIEVSFLLSTSPPLLNVIFIEIHVQGNNNTGLCNTLKMGRCRKEKETFLSTCSLKLTFLGTSFISVCGGGRGGFIPAWM